MFIKHIAGYELEKAQPNTSEDFFNRSEVTYIVDGVEKTLYVLYVRFYEEKLEEFTVFRENPVFTVDDRQVFFKEIVALVCLLANHNLSDRKRIYIKDQEGLALYFKDVSIASIKEAVEQIIRNGSYNVQVGGV